MKRERGSLAESVTPPSPATSGKSPSSKRKKVDVFIARELADSDGYEAVSPDITVVLVTMLWVALLLSMAVS
jgi:hypothetical protein